MMSSTNMRRVATLLITVMIMTLSLTVFLPKASASEPEPAVPDFTGETSEDAAEKVDVLNLMVLPEEFIPESEETQFSAEEPIPYVSTCCERMNVVRQTTEIWHIYQDPAGPCLSVAYFGYLYCTYCGTRYSDEVCYKQEGGCGSWHGTSSAMA